MRVLRSNPHQTARTFVAVDIGPDIREALRPAVTELQHVGADVRWVAEENWHLTVKFLGEVDWLQVGDIGKAVQEVVAQKPVFDLGLRGLHAFPPDRAPRIVAASVTEGHDALVALHEALDARLEEFGVLRERRAFRAHLTLGRINTARGGERLWEALTPFAELDFGLAEIGEAVFFQSELRPLGPLYTPLATARFLKGG